MDLSLKKATEGDCPLIHSIQVKSFADLLQKYEDYESSPAAESLDQIRQRFDQPYTEYYLIQLGDQTVGAIRICNFGVNCRISPICILQEYQAKGYAQEAIRQMELLYPGAKKWELDTIAQEEKLCHLYEKLGYHKTGRVEHVKDGMDLVFYEKEIS